MVPLPIIVVRNRENTKGRECIPAGDTLSFLVLGISGKVH